MIKFCTTQYRIITVVGLLLCTLLVHLIYNVCKYCTVPSLMKPPTHPYLNFCPDMASLCKPLNSIGIDYLSYTRVYKNGDRIYLTSLPLIMEEHFAQKQYLRCGNEKHPDHYDSGEIILWSTLPNQSIYNNARLMGAGHGIYLFGEKNEDYCDSLGFATSEDNMAVVNNYFNHFDTIQNFLPYFHEQGASLLTKAEQHKIVLPFNDGQVKDDFSKHLMPPLSKRQKECAYLLMQGMPAKTIARNLDLSVRTVEDYLQQLKSRLQCRNKTELVLKLIRLFNVNC